ncbi:AI-2E family transporter [Noviluteimonas gilva]|uniref:AI-2E family transporter n=1 Tax=Noviluteimonas gilva TaxID=2682097 RepID=A0A7C9LN71_9GAMM|nr:AI-2E family transporter [Lysobacter gilvus]MUV15604.1 AI-2E family transporter [Lysobacter gilvus]
MNTVLSPFARRIQWAAIILIAGVLVWLLAPILTPFVFAAMLGWLGDPLVDRLQKRGWSRHIAVVIVFCAMTFVVLITLVLLLPLIERQIVTLVESLPTYRDWFIGTVLPWFERHTGLDLMAWLDPDRLFQLVRTHWESAGGVATTALGYLSSSGFALIGWIANIVLVPFLTFYFLRDWDVLVERVAALVPRDHIETVTRLAKESDQVLGAFLRGQFSVMLVLGVLYALGLWAVGLDLGLLIGFIAGIVSFVPYLGPASGVVLGVIAALVQYGDWKHVALVLGVFGIGQVIESYFLTPRLVGDKIGLHPVAVIFAIMAGGQLFGFLGVLLALPIAAVANVLLRYAHDRYTHSRLFTGDRAGIDLDPYVDAGLERPAPDEDHI